METLTILQGDVLDMLREIPDETVQCVCTSPPFYGLRDYGMDGQLGLEKTPEEFIAKLTEVFREVRRVLRKDGTLFCNMGDSYASSGTQDDTGFERFPHAGSKGGTKGRAPTSSGYKPKDLIGTPWMLAFALRADGWWLRQDIIWAKPNPMPESVTDRCTKSHEYIFLLTKSAKYFYDAEAIKEPSLESDWESRLTRDSVKSTPTEKVNGIRTRSTFGNRNGELDKLHSGKQYVEKGVRNKRSVWTISPHPYPDAHFATFPEEIPKICILAGTKAGDTVLDPFAGSGTTGKVALELGRKAVLIELNPNYIKLIQKRCQVTPGLPL